MTVEEYRESLMDDFALDADAKYTTQEDEFISYATGILIDAEEFDDFVECYYEGVSRQRANMRIDGYSMDDTDGSCCVFISDYRYPKADDIIYSDAITASFAKIKYFINECIKYEFYHELEESTEVYEFARTLYYEHEKITKFRLYLLTNAFNRQRSKNIKDSTVAGKTVELNVWDINRLFDVVSSRSQKESIEINFSEYGVEGIPCVKAVSYENAVADIEVFPIEKLDGEAVSNLITYSSYLAVFPGNILCDLYLEHGSRLLEGNVRSYLSARGKVNKGILSTIKNYPEMFFAYNNGIAATAAELDTKMTPNGMIITRIKDLQIVNGGQTTASLASAVLTAKKDEKVDVGAVFVPMKVSVLEHSMSELIIPKISEYSNSQNKVDASDFFSNHPFHIRMEGLSRKIHTPAVHGNQYQQYWYYERTRGQYNQGKMKFKPKSAQMKAYEDRYPEKQVIKMVDLARYMELYFGAPDIVSKGKQEIVKHFAEQIKKEWAKSDADFNQYYYKRVVALAIIFHETDDIIKETKWYKEKKSYKANVIAYTISILFDYIKNNYPDKDVNFLRIWDAQELYPEMRMQLSALCTEVYEFITREDRYVENVTQWCKREACWDLAKKQTWNIQSGFIQTLCSKSELLYSEKEAKAEQKVANEVDALKFIMQQGGLYWEQMLNWSVQRKLISEIERSILKQAASMEETGKVLTKRQADTLLKCRERMIKEGMPLQF